MVDDVFLCKVCGLWFFQHNWQATLDLNGKKERINEILLAKNERRRGLMDFVRQLRDGPRWLLWNFRWPWENFSQVFNRFVREFWGFLCIRSRTPGQSFPKKLIFRRCNSRQIPLKKTPAADTRTSLSIAINHVLVMVTVRALATRGHLRIHRTPPRQKHIRPNLPAQHTCHNPRRRPQIPRPATSQPRSRH